MYILQKKVNPWSVWWVWLLETFQWPWRVTMINIVAVIWL